MNTFEYGKKKKSEMPNPHSKEQNGKEDQNDMNGTQEVATNKHEEN